VDDETPRRTRFDDNRPGAEALRRKDNLYWNAVLERTKIDTMDEDDQKQIKSDLLWIRQFRTTQRARRRAATAALALAIPLLGILGGWVEQATSHSSCPNGDVCIPASVPTPSSSPTVTVP
jgi:hypothetical protein